jgi:hypothetical protein
MVKSVLRGVGRPGLEPGTNALKGLCWKGEGSRLLHSLASPGVSSAIALAQILAQQRNSATRQTYTRGIQCERLDPSQVASTVLAFQTSDFELDVIQPKGHDDSARSVGRSNTHGDLFARHAFHECVWLVA